MHKIKFSLIALLASLSASAQGPEVTSYLQNTVNIGTTQGSPNGILTNCQAVYYDASNVYISATCMAAYDIGPWPGNPNTSTNQNKTWKITRTPVENTGTKTKTALGAIGIWINGVEVFNQKDGQYWNGTNFVQGNGANWNRNALYYEGNGFDACLGHPAPGGAYHHHVNPTCLYNDGNPNVHSPIIGYAFDGFPIYGAYAYTNVNGTGPIKRMQSSYTLNATRTGVPTPPPVNATYPLGCLCEDYTYTAGAGDLDAYNGRFCITPEYPSGTYAYFVTIDASGNPEYPFILGNEYYGTVPAGNTGPGGGNNTIPGGAVQYLPFPLGINNSFVALDNFKATMQKNDVQITWSTSFEKELNYFVVERSRSGGVWEEIFTTPATNTSSLKEYETMDYTPYNGVCYYRIKAVAYDNTIAYSEIQRVDLDNLFDDINLYPNPFQNQLSFTTDGSVYNYKITNFMGEVVMKGSAKDRMTVNTSALPNGIYLLELTNPVTDISKSRKIVKTAY